MENEVFKTTEIITEHVAELVKLCLAYEVPKLLAQITPQVHQHLTLDNCLEIYHLAASHDFEEVRVAAYNYFLRLVKNKCHTVKIPVSIGGSFS